MILDRLCALGVAGLILYLSYRLYKTAFPVLVDEFAIDPVAIKAAALNVSGVEGVGRIRSRWIGSDISLDMVVLVNAKLTTEESHRIADKIEIMIEEQFKVQDAVIHIEPFK
ncbi:MAG: cation diffusion facilitator family transporter [Porticoccaceae bacterium]